MNEMKQDIRAVTISDVRGLLLSTAGVGLDEAVRQVCRSLKNVLHADLIVFIPSHEVQHGIGLKVSSVPEAKVEGCDEDKLLT